MDSKFIVFEGIDGSGKGTQAKIANNYLFDKDKKYHSLLTREPFYSQCYDEIRSILKNSQDPMANATRLSELFVEDRKAHLENLILPVLAGRGHVVCDRYKHSTLAYQQTQGISFEELNKMHNGLLVPDLTFIVNVPVIVALDRAAKDEGREYKEVFEKREFQEKLKLNYLKLKEQLPDENIHIIDGNLPVKTVFDSFIKQKIDALFE